MPGVRPLGVCNVVACKVVALAVRSQWYASQDAVCKLMPCHSIADSTPETCPGVFTTSLGVLVRFGVLVCSFDVHGVCLGSCVSLALVAHECVTVSMKNLYRGVSRPGYRYRVCLAKSTRKGACTFSTSGLIWVAKVAQSRSPHQTPKLPTGKPKSRVPNPRGLGHSSAFRSFCVLIC